MLCDYNKFLLAIFNEVDINFFELFCVDSILY